MWPFLYYSIKGQRESLNIYYLTNTLCTNRSDTYTNDMSDDGSATPNVQNVFNEEAPKLINVMSEGASLPVHLFTNRPQYELPNLQDLSVRDDVKEQNIDKFDTQQQASKYQPIVPQPLGGSQELDDGIPKLPDLGWVSDQGEVDPLCRLYKAESNASDASKRDLMSDLPSGDDV